jgi:hypothetical protein
MELACAGLAPLREPLKSAFARADYDGACRPVWPAVAIGSRLVGMSETVLAAMIGAGATLVTALFQLVSVFRNSANERRSTKGARGGLRSLMWTVALILAAGVGGFAYAEFRSQESRDANRTVRDELQAQMQALQASTARLEQLRFASVQGSIEGGVAAASSSAATVTLPACKGAQVGFATARGACTEQDALEVALCAPVPAAAQVTGVELFSRSDDALTPWPEARTAAGQEMGSGRFAQNHSERADGEHGKLVCQSFSHWGGKSRSVRILVRYSTTGARTPG